MTLATSTRVTAVEAWLRAGTPRGSGLPPHRVTATQIVALVDSLEDIFRRQRNEYAAYIREHPPARPVLKATPFDKLPPGAALEWQTWLATVIHRPGTVDVTAEGLTAALQAAAREGVGEGAIAGAKAAGLLPAGAKTLTLPQARKALAEIGAFEASGDRARQAIWQAINQATRTKGVRALVLRDGAGRIVAAASYRIEKDAIAFEYIGALEREVPGTGVQLMREVAAVAAKKGRGLSVAAGPESEPFFSGLSMQRAPAGIFALAPVATSSLASGTFGAAVPKWIAAGWLEGPAARFAAADGAATLVGENGSLLAAAEYELGGSGPLLVTDLELAADMAPGIERRMLRELATVARAAGKGMELPVVAERAALYARLGANARAAWGVQEAEILASGLSAVPGFSGQMAWELGVAGAPEWLQAHRIKGVVDEISATTHEALVNTLADGLQAGETTEQLARRVMNLDKAFGRLRAERIARTEVLTANRWGALAIAKAGGSTEKEWHAQVASMRTRRWHKDAHKQRAPIDEPFVVNNRLGEPERLMVPGDYESFGAGPDNCINCRCSVRWMKPGVTYEPPAPEQYGLAGTPGAPGQVVGGMGPETFAKSVRKHYPGRHDQSRHGNRQGAAAETKQLFHGTTDQAAPSIASEGFKTKPASQYRFGEGVYLTTSQEQADYWANRAARLGKDNAIPRVMDVAATVKNMKTIEFADFAATVDPLIAEAKAAGAFKGLDVDGMMAKIARTKSQFFIDQGYDAILIRAASQKSGETFRDWMNRTGGDQIVVFDRAQVRVQKHSPGGHDHDQRTHGRRDAAAAGEPEKPSKLLYRPSAERIAALQKQAEATVRAWAEKNGVSFEVGMTRAQDLMTEAAAEPVKINTTIDAANEILDDGRFETQFESGTSRGNYDPELRAKAEKAGLGLPLDIPVTQRPVYGYTWGQASQYGEIQWVLKDSAKARTTITLGDSLGGFLNEVYDDPEELTGMLGTPASAPRLEGFNGRWRTDGMMRSGLNSMPFVEAQIQGGVTLDDIQEVRVHGYKWTDEHEALLNRLLSMGIDAYMETQ